MEVNNTMAGEIKENIYKIVREIIDDEEMVINDDSNLVIDLELSSLELAEMLSKLEKIYKIKISDSIIRKMITIQSTTEILMKYIADKK